MRPNLAPRLSSRLPTPHNPPPRVSGYTASARTFARPSLPRLSALETRRCTHRIQHPYQQEHQQRHQRHRQYYSYYYPRNLSTSYNYNYEYQEDEECDDRFQRYCQPMRSAPGTLTFVNLLIKRFLCILTCSPCGLRGVA